MANLVGISRLEVYQVCVKKKYKETNKSGQARIWRYIKFGVIWRDGISRLDWRFFHSFGRRYIMYYQYSQMIKFRHIKQFLRMITRDRDGDFHEIPKRFRKQDCGIS